MPGNRAVRKILYLSILSEALQKADQVGEEMSNTEYKDRNGTRII